MSQAGTYNAVCDDIRAMIGISEADFELFRRHRAFFLEHAGALVQFIHNTLANHQPTYQVFVEKRGDVARLLTSLQGWLGEVLDGHDSPTFWHRHYLIGIQHIQRNIPNRHMQVLATRIRQLLLPLMLDKLGQHEGLDLYLAFQRFLDTVVALTTSLVEIGQVRCLSTATGMSPKLLERLQATAFQEIADELRGNANGSN